MEKTWGVEFQNVGSCYFPRSRVDCHYTINPQHAWASNDWIGLFKVGWSSVRDYHTFVWALAPSSYKEGRSVNCCVNFQASYLPGPSAQQYQFVYVDGKGEVCSRSTAFTFSAPKPLEDLVTLEEEGQGEEVGEDMLLVIPRAQLLQSRLQECLKERAELLKALEAADQNVDRETERRERDRSSWEQNRKELERNISELKEEVRKYTAKLEEMKKKQKEVENLGEALAEEKRALLAQKEANEQRIRELEEDIKVLTQRGLERETDLERMREQAKKASAQKEEDDDAYKNLKLKMEQTEKELHSLSAEFQSLRNSLAQRDTHALQLRDTITTLTHKLNSAHRKEAANEVALGELRSVQERLNVSECCVEALRVELRDMVAQRDTAHAELHQARLQAAQLTLQLADVSLALREGRASSAQERETLQQNSEMDKVRLERLNEEIQQKEEMLQEARMEKEKAVVELGREKDCNRVQLSETRRELQDLKANLRVAQKEKEQLQTEIQEVIEYSRQLERRLEVLSDSKWSETALRQSSHAESPLLSDSEDENPEALQDAHSSGPLNYSLCEQPQADLLLPATPPPSPRHPSNMDIVVISQPAPLSSPHQPNTHTHSHSSESEEEYEAALSSGHSSGEETALLLPHKRDATLGDLAESPMW
ncbi:calcium-binding and coiled-coil domain-containing protein 1-like isoform X1 [Myxocyprinus asiaticus]|uniref:calcium-binding and coiled-coil domain-containing protein 1-like isoform X1 n=1 Tax=Myxocyprinus asiaticus TaxID=70543 RepID=UPI0022216A32|nr:calcium-binding and coiled-coil domain-containing protein 1-like isoform X1 [Myxocyprinus asiaticus]XP_051516993.1 calcium-binding and coiled-coil domain-containing protein 1-like isoform X1 [Myxocyprinus asiaticus]XP_051516994.1 calcium-binding and coiled-coil domain-containing protein 1-like isoform X1 [Myxocyprinus asiaticus]